MEEKAKWVRAIFIGNDRVGKTSLIRALKGENVKEDDTNRNDDIEISKWTENNIDITVHFWDFGNKVITNAIHQFFLRPHCVYVLVIEAGSVDSDPNQEVENWLKYISSFDTNTPILLVGNKCDLRPVHVNLHDLRKDYPCIHDFYGLSATQYRNQHHDSKFKTFRNAFIEQLQKVTKNQPYSHLSGNQFAIIDTLRKNARKDPFLKKTDFNAVCKNNGIRNEKQEEFLHLLNQLGEIIYFPDLYRLYGCGDYLLNPRWLIYGIFQILYSNVLKLRHGEFYWDEVRMHLKNKVTDEQGNPLIYSDEKLNFLIRAMEKFKLCYPSSDAPNEKWVVPNLLPNEQPERLDFPRRDTLRFEFDFKTFLPRHVLGTFIVEHYADIHDRQAWQHGVHLKSRTWSGTEALIQANYPARVFALEVNGPLADRYFNQLYASILKILERMPKLRYEKLLYLDEKARTEDEQGFIREPTDKDAHANFSDLLAADAQGKREVVCRFGRYDLEKLLRPMSKREKTTASALVTQETSEENKQVSTLAVITLLILGLGALGTLLVSDTSPSPWKTTIICMIILLMIVAVIVWLWSHRKKLKNGFLRFLDKLREYSAG
uniref:non-specific serine/threonine protein kinase n=1 Tax=Candidatus Kentrum sp. TUN TaxID=2126343 RepID=A0A450ZNN2_9GAMM|nr:MAG: small GTP-binding protein domain-containing protein [Candidatus Kentron sp. TUN]VFK57451.1 MAG: small GTP-binding protein domain-containing protein [Candidatus Kentron sp. TUN]